MSESTPEAQPVQQDEPPEQGAYEAAAPETEEEPGDGREGAGEHDGPRDEEPRGEDPQGEGPEDDGPRPLGLRVEPTGYGPVDERLRRLEDADRLAVSGHLEMYEDVHRGLRDTLTSLDRPAPSPAPTPAPRS